MKLKELASSWGGGSAETPSTRGVLARKQRFLTDAISAAEAGARKLGHVLEDGDVTWRSSNRADGSQKRREDEWLP